MPVLAVTRSTQGPKESPNERILSANLNRQTVPKCTSLQLNASMVISYVSKVALFLDLRVYCHRQR